VTSCELGKEEGEKKIFGMKKRGFSSVLACEKFEGTA
jgi:hypothetical protein